MDADTMTELAASYRRHQEQTAIEQHLAHVGNDTHTAVASQWNGQRWISRDGARERGFHRESNNPLEGGCVLDDARRRRTVPRAGAAAEDEAASEGEGGRGGTGEGEEGGSGGDGLGGAQYRAMMERLAGGSGGGGLALPQLVPSNSTAEMLPAGGLFPSPIKSSASAGASAEAEAGQADEAQCCAICLEKKMVDPTTTPCKHVFCRKCVDSFLNAKLRARNDRRRRGGGGGSGGFGGASGEEGLDDFLSCPMCRAPLDVDGWLGRHGWDRGLFAKKPSRSDSNRGHPLLNFASASSDSARRRARPRRVIILHFGHEPMRQNGPRGGEEKGGEGDGGEGGGSTTIPVVFVRVDNRSSLGMSSVIRSANFVFRKRAQLGATAGGPAAGGGGDGGGGDGDGGGGPEQLEITLHQAPFEVPFAPAGWEESTVDILITVQFVPGAGLPRQPDALGHQIKPSARQSAHLRSHFVDLSAVPTGSGGGGNAGRASSDADDEEVGQETHLRNQLQRLNGLKRDTGADLNRAMVNVVHTRRQLARQLAQSRAQPSVEEILRLNAAVFNRNKPGAAEAEAKEEAEAPLQFVLPSDRRALAKSYDEMVNRKAHKRPERDDGGGCG